MSARCGDCGHYCQQANCFTCNARACPRIADAPAAYLPTPEQRAYEQEWQRRRLAFAAEAGERQ